MDAMELARTIRRAQEKDPEAYDTLVDAYSDRLYGFFYRLTGRRDDADDLLQDLFLRVVRMIEQYKHDGRFEAWLFRIATNLVRDRVRRKTRKPLGLATDHYDPEIPGSRDPLGEQPEQAEWARPESHLDRAEQMDRLQTALEQLPKAEREVVMLRHFSELSFKEVAETMGTPIGTALARAHRGIARLREIMKDPDDDVRRETA